MQLSSRLRSEAGFTLTEMLVAIGAGMIVFLAAMALLDSSQSAAVRVQDRVDATQKGRGAMELISQRLRSQTCLGTGIPALREAYVDRVAFYTEQRDFSAAAGTGFRPELRRLAFGADGRVVEERWASQAIDTSPFFVFGSYPSNPASRTQIASGVQRSATTSYLRYFAFAGSDPATPTLEIVPSAAGMSEADRARIVRMVVTFDSRPTRTAQSTRVDSSFENEVYVRTSDPTDPTHSPQCL